MKKSITKIGSQYGIAQYRLHNGLRVLYKRETSAPVVAICVTFHVGSRNEAPGHTGSTHILEHLLFKDTPKFNKKNGNVLANYLELFGANLNATTWLDRTNYYELLPNNHFSKALEAEADRMRNSLFTDADLASEMTAVRNEYEISRNNPFELLDEEVMATAFHVHPYRIPTIGTKEDIEGSTAKKLREFYDTFYWPNNATLSIFGDVLWDDVQKPILKYFGSIPSSPQPIPTMDIVEPEQQEPREMYITKPLGLTITSVGYKIPEGTHPDFTALSVLGTILGGGFSSRLQQALVDTGLAADIGYTLFANHDPSLMTFTAHVTEHTPPQKVLKIMRQNIQNLQSKGPSIREIKQAKERIRSQFSWQRDGVFSEVRAVSEYIAAGDWSLGYRLEKETNLVTASDIKRVAKKYLTLQRETAGILTNS